MDNNNQYAELPGELLKELLDNVDPIAEKASSLLQFNEQKVVSIGDQLRNEDLIKNIDDIQGPAQSVIAVDGGSVFDKMTAVDLLVAIAVGVEGVQVNQDKQWSGKNQYRAWSGIMSHEEYNTRLLQGIMHLMEMVVLGESDYDIMIMDGSHITPIIKINSLLSANEEGAGEEYCNELRKFLKDKFDKIIPDIPDIFEKVFTDKRIIGIAKYSSSKDFLEGVIPKKTSDISLDDKAFFSVILKENEYTVPQPFGQSEQERTKRWNGIHITCNLAIQEKDQLNESFRKIIQPISTKNNSESSLYYLYFKPVGELAYRIEIKKELAEKEKELATLLYNIKRQVAFPHIIEPVPQFIADSMAKYVGNSTSAIKEAIKYSKKFKIDKKYIGLFESYRS